MARYRRKDRIEVPVAEGLEVDRSTCSVDLIARRATGVDGLRRPLQFIAEEGGSNALVDLDPAPGRREARERGEQLRGGPEKPRELLRAELDA